MYQNYTETAARKQRQAGRHYFLTRGLIGIRVKSCHKGFKALFDSAILKC